MWLFRRPSNIPQWTFEQVKQQATRPEKAIQLIDVREVKEHSSTSKHAPIPTAISMPMSSFSPEAVQTLPQDTVVFYCEAGVRAQQAAERVLQHNTNNKQVAYYPGSHKEWRAKSA